jgi:hypothetical protein
VPCADDLPEARAAQEPVAYPVVYLERQVDDDPSARLERDLAHEHCEEARAGDEQLRRVGPRVLAPVVSRPPAPGEPVPSRVEDLYAELGDRLEPGRGRGGERVYRVYHLDPRRIVGLRDLPAPEQLRRLGTDIAELALEAGEHACRLAVNRGEAAGLPLVPRLLAAPERGGQQDDDKEYQKGDKGHGAYGPAGP